MKKTVDFSSLTGADVLDLGILAEEEARQRYQDFAATMANKHGNAEAASFFAAMERHEGEHRDSLEEQRRLTYPDAPTRVDASFLFDVEAPDYGVTGAALSYEECLRLCLAAEERAERYYRDALPHAADPVVHDLLVQLADQEVRHQEQIRAELEALTGRTTGS